MNTSTGITLPYDISVLNTVRGHSIVLLMHVWAPDIFVPSSL